MKIHHDKQVLLTVARCVELGGVDWHWNAAMLRIAWFGGELDGQ